MKKCPSCQIKYPDDAAICGHCGARLMLDTSATMPDPKQMLVGRVLAGNFRVDKLIGSGGMGVVFQARQLSLDRDVAVKVLLAPLAMDREALARFQREAKSASNIGHPGIVQVIDMGYLKEGPPFMVMELLQGEDLRHAIRSAGTYGVNQAIPVILQICDALQAAHDKGIVHRDLKPDNIFLVPRKNKAPMVKLLDFGLSKIKTADKKLTNTGALLGTPNYMAPEQVRGEAEVDQRVDVYAAGVILYEMLTGEMAYDGPSIPSIFFKIMTEDPKPPRMLRPDLPEQVEALILKAMARNEHQRFQTMNDMASELVRIGNAAGVPRSEMSVIPSGPRPQAAATAQTPQTPQMPGFPQPAGPYPQTPHAAPVPGAPPPGAAPPSPYGPPRQSAPPYGGYPAQAPLTPPGYSAQRMAGLPGKSSKGISVGIILGLLAAGLLFVGVVVIGVIVLAVAAGRKQAAGQLEEPSETIIFTSDDDDDDDDWDDSSEESGRAASKDSLGHGMNPHLCCGGKGCGLAYQKEDDDRERIYFQVLTKDLKRTKDPVLITIGKESGMWPACFARDDGGYLVFYQFTPLQAAAVPTFQLHRVTLSSKGAVETRKMSEMRSPYANMEMVMPAYSSAAAGDRVFVTWNHMEGISSGVNVAAFTMGGKETGKQFSVTNNISLNIPSIACGKDKCLLAWSKPTLSADFEEIVCVISASGTLLKKDIEALSGGHLRLKRALVPAGDSAVMVWMEQDDKYTYVLKSARLNWNGKVITNEKPVEGFSEVTPMAQHQNFAAASSDGKIVAVTLPAPSGKMGQYMALAVSIDREGKASPVKAFSPDYTVAMESAVFPVPDGPPVIIYQAGTFGDNLDFFAAPYKP